MMALRDEGMPCQVEMEQVSGLDLCPGRMPEEGQT